MFLAWRGENAFWKGCSSGVHCEAGTVDTVVASSSFRLSCGFLHDSILLTLFSGDFVLESVYVQKQNYEWHFEELRSPQRYQKNWWLNAMPDYMPCSFYRKCNCWHRYQDEHPKNQDHNSIMEVKWYYKASSSPGPGLVKLLHILCTLFLSVAVFSGSFYFFQL